MGSQSPAPLGDLRNIQNNDSPENSPKQDATNEIHRSLNNASLASLLESLAPTKPCVPSYKMNNTPRAHASTSTSTSMPHNPALEGVIPHDNSRASEPPPPPLPRQALGVVSWGARQENVRHTTHSPLAEVGFASFPVSPTFPNANANSTGFSGLASMQTSSLAGVSSSFGNIGGGAGMIARPTHTLLGCPWPQPQTSQDHKAIPGMLESSSVDCGCHNPSESSGRLESELADDVLAAAAAAAVEQPQPRNLKFGDLDVDSIDLNVAIFYFGVLSIVASLHPHFSYERTAEGNWRAFLMYWGAATAASKDEAYEDKFVAKAETCRSALEGLKEKYSGWALPELPGPKVTLGVWIWTALLQEYCQQNKLNRPTYTKYAHEEGFRYEVEVGGTSFFGTNKFYKTTTEAIHASAHAALYSLLITGPEIMSMFQGIPQAMRKRHVSRSRLFSGDPGVPTAPGPTKQGGKKAGKGKKKAKGNNANLLPIPTTNRRLPTVVVRSSETKNHKISSGDLELMTKKYSNPCERVEKICSLLSMEQPEYHITPLEGQADGTAVLFSAASRFPNDPFLARVGNIGRTKYVESTQMAKEKCAAQVVGYLMKMVREDEEWEQEDPGQKVGENIRRWEGMAALAAAGMSDSGVNNVDSRADARAFGKGGAGVDPFGSDAKCDFIPFELEESVKIKEEEVEGEIV
ncbi:hypothetical protein EMPG_11551 [Blastomyces silverae]|uniref:Uncharacterized protein n=1 Tax=Blastomyces silverae TaxID=2060906 RepID=A0A0H1BR63_9EURO|nr:hypothetical protein EMPG_11551 [Blastomyces silverae]